MREGENSMAGKYERPRKKKRGRGLVLLAVLLILGVAGAFVLRTPGGEQESPENEQTQPPQTVAVSTEAPAAETVTEPTEPEPVVKESTATIGATGDILLHDLVIKSGYDKETDSYNYDNIFTFFSEYVSQVDYAAANLEVTLCGDDNGYAYSGYPCFNSPDEIVDAAKAAGFDLLLTANNHSYDTKFTGFTQQVIDERGLDHIGTRLDAEEKNYIIREINGINIAMTCYTYCSAYTSAGNFKLNGNALSSEASKLVNAFHYKDLDTFYTKLAGEMEQMKADGAEAVVMFIHWGEEYKTSPNDAQKKIAQQLCNMGVDVIVGTHPHVVEPAQLLTSTTDPAHQTVCLYSLGNAVSNQRFGSVRRISTAHTEDGLFFTFTFCKYSDGSVYLSDVELLPLWMEMRPELQRSYNIIPLDDSLRDQWQSLYGRSDAALQSAGKSYNRTSKILGTAGTELREALAAARELREADYLADWVGAQYATEEST